MSVASDIPPSWRDISHMIVAPTRSSPSDVIAGWLPNNGTRYKASLITFVIWANWNELQRVRKRIFRYQWWSGGEKALRQLQASLASLKSFFGTAILVAILRNVERHRGCVWLNPSCFGDLWVQITLTGWGKDVCRHIVTARWLAADIIRLGILAITPLTAIVTNATTATANDLFLFGLAIEYIKSS